MQQKQQEQKLVQIHTRVRVETKDAIKKIAKDRRCQIGAVIEEAIQLYERSNP